MNGPEHYKKAEQHLAWADEAQGGSDMEGHHHRAAHTHATLALVGLLATRSPHALPMAERKAWAEVLGVAEN